jgi:hypothetical protein
MAFALVSCVGGLVLDCGGRGPPPPPGNLYVQVLLPGDEVLDSIDYSVEGNGTEPIHQQALISGSPTSISALFVGIPAGEGYLVKLTAKSHDGLATCSAAANADVKSHETTNLVMPLRCVRSVDGRLVVDANFACPTIASVTAAPSTTSVGGEVDLQAQALPASAGTPQFSWTTTTGKLSDAASAVTGFTCTATGPAAITATVSVGACADHVTLTVTCLPSS